MTSSSTKLIALALLTALGGCYGHSSTPELQGTPAAIDSANSLAAEQCATLAVKWVADRYPPRNDRAQATTPKEAGDITIRFPMVVNMPKGTRKAYYERMARNCGPEVYPMSPEVESAGLPVYHVGRIWTRAHEAKVDVYRPMPEIESSPGGGGPVYQMITVILHGGFSPWRVVHGRAWEPGAHPVPPVYYIPGTDRPDQYEYEKGLEQSRDAGGKPAPAQEEINGSIQPASEADEEPS